MLLAYVNNYWLVTNPLSAFHRTTVPASIQGPFIAIYSRQLSHRLCIPTKKHDVHPREVQQLAPWNSWWVWNDDPASFWDPVTFTKALLNFRVGMILQFDRNTQNATQTTLRRFSGYTKINASNHRKWADPWIYRYRLVVKGWQPLLWTSPKNQVAFKPAEK